MVNKGDKLIFYVIYIILVFFYIKMYVARIILYINSVNNYVELSL